MTVAKWLAPLALFGAGLLVGSGLDAANPAPKVNVQTLMRVPLAEEFTPGREVLIDVVEIPPNTSLDRHWHPGEEFHYYLEGEVEIRIDGEPSIKGTPGTVGHIPFEKRHMAVAGEKGAKVVVFRVHTGGEPLRFVDEPESPEQK